MSRLFEVLEEPSPSSTKTNEWYTPPFVLDRVRTVLGSIELDPASCDFANQFVQAKRFFTIEDNALMHPWIASSVFLNPPYGRTSTCGSNLEHFTRHLIEQYECSNTKEAILLIPSNTATSWFEPLWQYAICFPVFRIRFLQSDGTQGSGQAFGTCLVYLGNNVGRFVEAFLQFGPVITPNGVHCRPHKVLQLSLHFQESEVTQ